MRHLHIISILVAFALSSAAASAQNGFISGIDNSYVFSAAQCGSAGKTASFTTEGKSFKVITFYYDNSTVTAVEDAAGKRSVLFMNGKPTVQTSGGVNYPKIGFEGGKELNTNEYAVGTHDFTDDAQPELVVSVRSATGDGLAIYIFQLNGASWKCIGEMVTVGHGIKSGRMFRQTATLKDPSTGVLYTWTYHNGHFDFLSSDRVDDPTVLY